MTRILYTCHEGCHPDIWGLCRESVTRFADLYDATLIELPKTKLRNAQWVLFDAMAASVADSTGATEFAWIDSDVLPKHDATDIWSLYPSPLTLCPNTHVLPKGLMDHLGVPMDAPFPNVCTGIVRWDKPTAAAIVRWVDKHLEGVPKKKANRGGDLGDQEIMIKIIYELGLTPKFFHPAMHVAGANPPAKTSFKHKGGGGKYQAIKKFLEMNEDYASRPDPYSTHLEVLAEHASGVAVEFGCGKYSTPLLIQKCDSVLSVEMQDSGWLEEVRGRVFNDCRWTGVEALGAFTFLGVQYPDHIDVGFVDGHGASRFACVNFLMRLGVKTIIAHDTERPGYQWDLIVPDGYTTTVHKEKTPWTTVWTKDAPK